MPVFDDMLGKRNTASKEAAWDALDMGSSGREGQRLRAFDMSLLSEPWVEIEVAGRRMKVLWHTHVKDLWIELNVLRLLKCIHVLMVLLWFRFWFF